MERPIAPAPELHRARRWLDRLGFLCVIATLLLLSSGVRIARADEASTAAMSVDPKLAERHAERAASLEAERAAIAAEQAAPRLEPGAVRVEMPPGVGGVEIEPGVILLNTRGYNPPPAPRGGLADPPEVLPAPAAPR